MVADGPNDVLSTILSLETQGLLIPGFVMEGLFETVFVRIFFFLIF